LLWLVEFVAVHAALLCFFSPISVLRLASFLCLFRQVSGPAHLSEKRRNVRRRIPIKSKR
jgi:hypothetical protein